MGQAGAVPTQPGHMASGPRLPSGDACTAGTSHTSDRRGLNGAVQTHFPSGARGNAGAQQMLELASSRAMCCTALPGVTAPGPAHPHPAEGFRSRDWFSRPPAQRREGVGTWPNGSQVNDQLIAEYWLAN